MIVRFEYDMIFTPEDRACWSQRCVVTNGDALPDVGAGVLDDVIGFLRTRPVAEIRRVDQAVSADAACSAVLLSELKAAAGSREGVTVDASFRGGHPRQTWMVRIEGAAGELVELLRFMRGELAQRYPRAFG